MSRTPRILHIIDTGGPGGAETMFAQLVSRWPGDKRDVVSVISRDGWLSSEMRRRGCEPRIISPKGSFNLGYLAKLRKLIREERIEVIIAHLYGSCIYASLAGLVTNVPVVGVLHGHSDIGSDSRLNAIKAMIVRRGLDRLICVSEPLKEMLTGKLGFPASRALVIPNGIDVAAYYPSQTPASENLVVGAIGNIRKPKSYDVLLRAAAIVSEQLPTVRFRIIGEGEGPLYDELLGLRDELGLAQIVEFAGFQPSSAELYASFDIYVSSSTTEGFSLTCVEAMACGLPAVATRSGGPEGIIEDTKTGVLVDVGDTEGLAAAIFRLAGDKDLRQSLGDRGRQSVLARFDIEHTVAAYAGLCEEVGATRS